MASGLRWTEEQLRQRVKNMRARALLDAMPVAAAQKRAGRPLPSPMVPDVDRMALVRASITKPPVKRKYRNEKVENEHGKFDSKKEAQRYAELVMLERAGRIAELRRQVPYALAVNGIFLCKYVADMVYREGERLVVEDVKGFKTDLYLLKKRLMLACHGIEVKET